MTVHKKRKILKEEKKNGGREKRKKKQGRQFVPFIEPVKANSVMLMKRSIINEANYPWCRRDRSALKLYSTVWPTARFRCTRSPETRLSTRDPRCISLFPSFILLPLSLSSSFSTSKALNCRNGTTSNISSFFFFFFFEIFHVTGLHIVSPWSVFLISNRGRKWTNSLPLCSGIEIDGERGEGDRLDLDEMKLKLKHFSSDYKWGEDSDT